MRHSDLRQVTRPPHISWRGGQRHSFGPSVVLIINNINSLNSDSLKIVVILILLNNETILVSLTKHRHHCVVSSYTYEYIIRILLFWQRSKNGPAKLSFTVFTFISFDFVKVAVIIYIDDMFFCIKLSIQRIIVFNYLVIVTPKTSH